MIEASRASTVEQPSAPDAATPSAQVEPSRTQWAKPAVRSTSRWQPPAARDDLSTIERLRDGRLTDAAVGWFVTLAITLLAFLIRLNNLGYPKNLVFDETYYAKDAWSMLQFGYERNWPDNANDQVVAGNPNVFSSTAEFVVHPPLGKWLIALGEHWFGMNAFGWRFMACVFGSLLVLATIRLARRLSRSTLIGGIAGLLLSLDGLAVVMSRTALLDVFQAFFIVAAVACCVADRDWYRDRLAKVLEQRGLHDFHGEFGPVVWLRPWRFAAGVVFGAALACKWNSVFVLAVFGIVSVLWDVGARRLAGANWRSWLAVLVDGIPAFIRLVVVGVAVYLSTWIPWLLGSGGYDRDWGSKNPDHPWVKAFGDAFASLLYFHKEIYEFHTGDYINNATHPYDAHPAGWLAMLRPTGFDAVNDIAPGTDGCTGTENCIRVISAMGTPVLWWMAAIALVVCAVWWIGGRDWRFGVPVLSALASYLPWFNYTDRPLFFFYAITMVPFTVIGLAMVMGLILGPADSPGRRRGAIIVGVAVALVALNFAYIYPVLTDELLPYSQWLSRMWLRSWI